MIRASLTDRQIEQLDQAREHGLAETLDMSDPIDRMKYIRHNYFPFGRPQDNWPAYNYWRSITDGRKKYLERVSA